MAMTSNETIKDKNFNLQNSINIKECKEEKEQVVVAKEIKLNIKGKQQIPLKHDILKSSTVGKPSRDHSFTSEACFEHIVIFLLKSEYLNEEDHRIVLASHPLILHLDKMLHWSKDIHFLDLQNHLKDYSKQTSISNTRIRKMLAATLNYDLDIPTLIRFLGGNYTGEYRKIEDTIKILKDSLCQD